QFYSDDYAGNTETVNTIDVWIDDQAPDGVVHINDGAQYANSTSVLLTASATDNSYGSGVSEMRFGNKDRGVITWADWQAYTTSVSWNLLPGDGTKIVCSQFKDHAGNAPPQNDYSCASITLDTGRPTVPVVHGTEGWTNICVPTFTWDTSTDSGSGIASY